MMNTTIIGKLKKLIEIIKQETTYDSYYFHEDLGRELSDWVIENWDLYDKILQELKDAKQGRTERPLVICLCGSTQFYEEFLEVAIKETRKGNIVLRPEIFSAHWGKLHSHLVPLSQDELLSLLNLHLQKIAMADQVIVINKGGYLGESTIKEVEYATKLGKEITYLEDHHGQ